MKNITCFPARGIAKTLVKTNTNYSVGSSFTIILNDMQDMFPLHIM